MVPKTSDDFPDPDTPVKTVSLRLGMSREMSSRLFSLAPRTSMTSWLFAATCREPGCSITPSMLIAGRRLEVSGLILPFP